MQDLPKGHTAISASGEPLLVFAGRGQVRLRHAVRISLGRAVHDRTRMYIGLGWFVIVAIIISVSNKSWVFGVTFPLLYNLCVTVLSVIAWRIRLVRQRKSIWTVLFLNGLLSFFMGYVCLWTSSGIPSIFVWGFQETLRFFLENQEISLWSLIFVWVGFLLTWTEDYTRRERRQDRRAEQMEALAEEAKAIALRSLLSSQPSSASCRAYLGRIL